jgi:predicted DNA-binding transcriptional regulator AlpA
MSPLLTNDQASELLGISPQTLHTWRSKKRGPTYIKVGSLIKYRPSDIEAFLREREVKPEPKEDPRPPIVRAAAFGRAAKKNPRLGGHKTKSAAREKDQ